MENLGPEGRPQFCGGEESSRDLVGQGALEAAPKALKRSLPRTRWSYRCKGAGGGYSDQFRT